MCIHLPKTITGSTLVITSEAFPVPEVNEIFLGHQPCQLVKNDQILIMGTETVPQTLIIFNQMTWLTAQED
jgi:hypothetical protein